MSSLKKFFIQFSHFFSGSVLTQLFGLITFPILTRILSIEQYGLFALITTTMMIVVVPAKAGMPNGIIRFYSEFGDTKERKTVFASTVCFSSFVFAIAATGIYNICIWLAKYKGFINSEYYTCFLIMSLFLLIRPLNIIVLNIMRVKGKTLQINIIELLEKAVSTTLSLILLIFIIKEIYGFFVGIVLGHIFVALILWRWLFKYFKLRYAAISKALLKSMMMFGMPLLLNEMCYLLLSYADRYLIVWIIDEGALGIYSVGYNLAMYIANAITIAVSYSIVPLYVSLYQKEGREKTEKFLSVSMNYLAILIIPVCFGYFIVSKELFILLASKKYAIAADFSYLILIGNILIGLNSMLNAGLYLRKKSGTILAIMLVSVTINIVLNLILIPMYGVFGASVATLFACVVSTILTICLSFKYIRIRFDHKKICFYLLLSTGMLFIIKVTSFHTLWIAVICKVLLGIGIVSIGVIIFEKDIRSQIVMILQKYRFLKS